MKYLFPLALPAAFAVLLMLSSTACGQSGSVSVAVVDEVGNPLACRMHLKDEAGKPVQVEGLPFWHDHFVHSGQMNTTLPSGTYTYEIERGPEWERQNGRFVVSADNDTRITVRLKRLADLSSEGWWSGELHVHRKLEDIELLMRAEDLHVAPVITWWNQRNRWTGGQLPQSLLRQFDVNRFYHVMGGEDERAGGALLYFNLDRPLDIASAAREFPSPMVFLHQAAEHPKAWIDIEKPFWWDVPVWLAAGHIDSIGLANNHMCRSQMYESEAWGKPRDETQFPAPRGNGFWTQEIYYHVLNCGMRIPPSAGSASGVLPNPLGYNRAYVHVGDRLTYDDWWRALGEGRSFVTNGPLLLCAAGGHQPGHVFVADDGCDLAIDIELQLISKDPVSTIELIKNGRVVKTIKCDPNLTAQRHSSRINFNQNGWFLVRAIADNQQTFRFASTAPYYVEIGSEKHRISRRSVRFFLDWVEQRIGRVNVEDELQKREVLKYHYEARTFWQNLLERANAE